MAVKLLLEKGAEVDCAGTMEDGQPKDSHGFGEDEQPSKCYQNPAETYSGRKRHGLTLVGICKWCLHSN